MEFKFRVWDKITEKMYYPFTGIADDLYLSLEGRICSEDEEVQEDGTHMAYRGYRMTPLFWTGFKDKNGKDIYYGDVVAIQGETTEGFYRTDNFEVTINEFTNITVIDSERGQMDLHKCFRVVEVIGNIYEMSDWDF